MNKISRVRVFTLVLIATTFFGFGCKAVAPSNYSHDATSAVLPDVPQPDTMLQAYTVEERLVEAFELALDQQDAVAANALTCNNQFMNLGFDIRLERDDYSADDVEPLQRKWESLANGERVQYARTSTTEEWIPLYLVTEIDGYPCLEIDFIDDVE